MRRLLCTCLAALVLPTAAPAGTAQPPDTTLYVVAPIVVRAKRRDPRNDLYDRSGFVASIDLGERRDRVEDLAAVLSQMVGVRVKQYGGLGDFATVSIRGSSASQVNVYLDGVPMNDPYSGIANLADLPLGGIQRVEIYRGFAPPHLGAGAIGGAVNLVSADRSRWRAGGLLSDLEVHASYGSYNTSQQQASAWLRPWKLRVFAHGKHTKTLGNFPFLDDNGTPLNPTDDETVDRANNDSESYGGLGRLEVDVPGLERASVTIDGYWREQGVAGKGAYQSRQARYERRRSLAHVELESKPILSNQLVLGGTAFYSHTNEKFRDPEGAISLGRKDTDNTITGWGGRVRGRWFVPVLPAALEVVLEQRTEQFHPVDNFLGRKGPDPWRRSRTAALSGDLYLLGQTLVLTGTQRWLRQVNEFFDDAPFSWLPPSPRGITAQEDRSPSVGFRFNPIDAVVVKGNVGRYQRLPTFLELFGNLGTVTGSGDLEPESGLNRDAGVAVTFGRRGWLRRCFLEVVYLDNESTHLILFFPNSQRTTKATNIGAARIRGWEFSFAATLAAGLGISGNYSRLDTRDTSDIPYYRGNRLPVRPLDDAMFAVSWQWRHFGLAWEGHYIGPNYLDRANMKEVGARHIHNVIVQLFAPAPGLSISVEARNVTGDRAGDVAGYPLPGRSFYTTLSYRK